jgi:hypothetical protein
MLTVDIINTGGVLDTNGTFQAHAGLNGAVFSDGFTARRQWGRFDVIPLRHELSQSLVKVTG